MCTYLFRRNSTYYFRRIIPSDVRSLFGDRSEWIYSLRTKSREEAKRLAQNEAVRTSGLIDKARGGGKHIAERPFQAVAIPLPSKPRGRKAIAQMRLDDVLDRWIVERNPGGKGKHEHIAVARWFKEVVGDKAISEFQRKDVHSFVEKLMDQGQSHPTINIKISRLSTIFGFAVHKGWVEQNAASGIRVKVTDAGARKRKPFNLIELNTIFSSQIYTEGARPAQGRGEAAYWLPLLALYTGARREELGQLRTKDIELYTYSDDEGRVQSSWFIKITIDKEDDLKLKNSESERIIPVHLELERLGLISYVDLLREKGIYRIFPDLKADVFNRLTSKWGEWFSRYLREVCGITDRRLVFHSFRHTFKDMARRSRIEEGLQRQIMGHSPGDIAGEYGEGFDEYRVVEAMRQYRVAGLVLPPPISWT